MCALKIDPRPMQRTGGAAAVLRFAFAQRHGFALEFADKTRTLQRIFVEQSFGFRHRFRRLTKTFLSVFQRFDEIINCRYCFLLCAILMFRTPFAIRVHSCQLGSRS